MRTAGLLLLLLAISGMARAASYAVVLKDPPAAERFPSREALHSAEAREYREHLKAEQDRVKRELTRRHITVTGSTEVLANAIYIKAAKEQAEELRHMDGVKAVTAMRRVRPLK